jgi:uncharacterized protein (DUF2062 family)
MAKRRRKLLKYMPDKEKLLQHKALRIFSKFFTAPELWHFNRNSVAKAVAIGLFCTWIPLPFHVVAAAFAALIFHANLSAAVGASLIINPLTMTPLFLFAYKVGARLMGIHAGKLSFANFSFSIAWVKQTLHGKFQPFFLGCLVCGVVSALVGYFGVKWIWRYFTVKNWKMRAIKKQQRGGKKKS